MTPKEIMKMEPEARLALEARARVGDVDAVSDWVMLSIWRAILARKAESSKVKVKAFLDVFRSVRVTVEPSNG
mgnify:FL=1